MSVTEKTIDFKRLEKEIFTKCNKMGCEVIKNTLQNYDKELMKSRDRKKYRHKGHHKTVIKTLMGEVEYSRAIYEYKNDDGIKSYVYLLDKAIGKEGSGFMSGLLSEKIAQASCESSYRNAARNISELTGQTISHTAAWNVVQDLGKRIDNREQETAALAAKNEGKGELETKILFEEQDGIWLKMQGKSRKKHGSSYEMKLAIAYDGAERVGKKRYRLTNKVACANFESTKKFQKRKEGIIADTYNIDEIETRIVNGDGAAWIKSAANDDNAHFQLDPFHRNKAIIIAAPDGEARKAMLDLLYSKKIDELMIYIDALANSVEDEKQEKNLRGLYTYFTNNKEGLVAYNHRGIDLPQPPDGKEHRGLGAMESNIFTVIGNRMKGGRACWSIDGGNNLARLLCLKHTNKLTETLKNLTSVVLPERYAKAVILPQEIITTLSASKVAKSVGKGYAGIHQATCPAISNYKWLREMGALQLLA